MGADDDRTLDVFTYMAMTCGLAKTMKMRAGAQAKQEHKREPRRRRVMSETTREALETVDREASRLYDVDHDRYVGAYRMVLAADEERAERLREENRALIEEQYRSSRKKKVVILRRDLAYCQRQREQREALNAKRAARLEELRIERERIAEEAFRAARRPPCPRCGATVPLMHYEAPEMGYNALQCRGCGLYYLEAVLPSVVDLCDAIDLVMAR